MNIPNDWEPFEGLIERTGFTFTDVQWKDVTDHGQLEDAKRYQVRMRWDRGQSTGQTVLTIRCNGVSEYGPRPGEPEERFKARLRAFLTDRINVHLRVKLPSDGNRVPEILPELRLPLLPWG